MAPRSAVVGVLALQGDFAEHLQIFRKLGAQCVEVRTKADLARVSHLVIPGGESTVISRFLRLSGLDDAIKIRVREGTLPVYGTCAGAILLAKNAIGKNAPPTLNLVDIDVERNAYGPQVDSFERVITVEGLGAVRAAFIRAPVIVRVGEGVQILAEDGGNPVLVRQGKLLAGTFHPEVRGETHVHKLFLGF